MEQDRGGQGRGPRRAVAEHDELADVVGAAAAGFGVHQGGELGGGRDAAQVAGGVGVAHRAALLVEPGLGEQAGEFDLPGAGPAVGALAGPVADGGGHHRYSGAVDGDVELVRRLAGSGAGRCRQHAHPSVCDRGRFGGEALGGAAAIGLG